MNTSRMHRIRKGTPARPGRLARTAAATTALCLLGGVGSAYAYWTAAGLGSGSATNGTMQTVTVDALVPGDTLQTSLVPGGSADVVLRITNPNPHDVAVHSVTASGPITADAPHPGCAPTGVTFTPPQVPATVIAANTSLLLTLPGAASMSTASPSACQGAQFTIPVTLEVRK